MLILPIEYLRVVKMTYTFGFNHDLLLVLTLERVTKKSKSKVMRRVQHPGSSYVIFRMCIIDPWNTYWESVLNTGKECVSLKFWMAWSNWRIKQGNIKKLPSEETRISCALTRRDRLYEYHNLLPREMMIPLHNWDLPKGVSPDNNWALERIAMIYDSYLRFLACTSCGWVQISATLWIFSATSPVVQKWKRPSNGDIFCILV